MAMKLALFLRRRPLVLLAIAVAATVVGGHFGLSLHKHGTGGLWDGPV